MAKSTAPILIVGGVTLFNRTMEISELNRMPISQSLGLVGWKIAAATGLAAGAFALLEKVNQPLAVGVAWVALLTTLLVPSETYSDGSHKRTPIETLQYAQKNPDKFLFK